MIWQIGDWTVDSTTDTIADGSQTRKLEHRATEVLLHLAERQGVVVTKDDLIANVWGRFAVSDHAVAMVISQLRQALGDDARTPRYIETITKRGYRLVATASQLLATPAERVPARAAATNDTMPSGWRFAVALSATIVAIAVALAIAALSQMNRASPANAPIILFSYFNDETGADYGYLAYGLAETIQERLWRGNGGPVVRWTDNGKVRAGELHRLLGPAPLRFVTASLRLERAKPILAVTIQADDDLHTIWRRIYAVHDASIEAHAAQVARDVAAALGMNFSEHSALRPYDPRAQIAYWKARHQLMVNDDNAQAIARTMLLRAIREFPDLAPAYALLADIDTTMPAPASGDEKVDLIGEARDALDKAERLALPNSRTESARSKLALFADRNLYAAVRHAQAAVEYNTGDSMLWFDFAELLALQGNLDEALHAIDRAGRLDFYSDAYQWQKAWMLFAFRKYQEADAAANEAARLSPRNGNLIRAYINDALKRDANAMHHWMEYARNLDLKPETFSAIQKALQNAKPGIESYRIVYDFIKRDTDFASRRLATSFLALKVGDIDNAATIIMSEHNSLPATKFTLWLDRIAMFEPLMRDQRMRPLAEELKQLRASSRHAGADAAREDPTPLRATIQRRRGAAPTSTATEGGTNPHVRQGRAT